MNNECGSTAGIVTQPIATSIILTYTAHIDIYDEYEDSYQDFLYFYKSLIMDGIRRKCLPRETWKQTQHQARVLDIRCRSPYLSILRH